MPRPIFLHEVIDIVGQASVPYMEHTKAQAGAEKVDSFDLVGTFSVMGITGRWPQVVNIWELPGGWAGWRNAVDRLNLKRPSNQALHGWWEQAYTYRTGGFDRLMAGHPGCPDIAGLLASGTTGTLFVHEVTEVRPGAALDYLDAVRDVRAPMLADHGHRLTGLYEVLLTDTEVVTLWATDVDAHVALGRCWDATRGLLDDEEAAAAGVEPDERLLSWEVIARDLTVRRREELLTPAPGTVVGPPAWVQDDSVR
ncbi:MAG: hypothetical protein MUE34_10410 [Acidimicrobiales bacterium]|jgi:hypothetical protein|nr:hypothetical protein [Acidimicrobiales bacterium]